MNIISWNISYASKIEKILDFLKTNIDRNDFIITLQEVTPSSFEEIQLKFKDFANVEYSLNYRKPGKYDTKSRKLGIAILTSKNFIINKVEVLNRALLPDRTLYLELIYNNQIIKVLSLHSITGCDYKKAKSIQFYSFAEAIYDLKPDIVSFDANEPEYDHYEIESMKFFDNKDKGMGAKIFFQSLGKNKLRDSYASMYDTNNYKEKEPLVISHIINKRFNKRYDFVFLNEKYKLVNCEYKLEESLNATSDHSLIKLEIKL